MLPFGDRSAAGRALGAAVRDRVPAVDVVLGLPRGGVVVAAEVAAALGVPLDVVVVRKLGAPADPELALGAVASGGVRVVNEALVRRLAVPAETLERVVAAALAELRRGERTYRGGRPPAALAGRTAVVVDDGLATGATVLAAVWAVRAGGARRVVAAAPVGAPEACARVAAVADELICLHAPPDFVAVGHHYLDFAQTSDEQVQQLLAPPA